MATALARLPLELDEPDKVVADVEVLTMHVLLLDDDGVLRWHRMLAGTGGAETACGNAIDFRHVQGQRLERCEGLMCAECFTVRELVKAALSNAAARRRCT